MNKKPLLIGVVIVGVIGAAFIFLTLSKEPSLETTGSETPVAQNLTTQTPAETSVTGRYVDYSDAEFEATTGTRMLFFHAPWCPQCLDLEADIQASGVPENVTIFKVDYDSSQNLRQKYGVTIQTTVVLTDDNGDLVKKYVAYDEPTLASVVNNLL